MKKLIIISVLTIFIASCSNSGNVHKNENLNDNAKQIYNNSPSEYNVSGTVWFQTSAEAKAIFLQTFYFAKIMLDKNIKIKSKLKKAIITDIDETVLDNSPFNARLIKHNKTYTDSAWNYWVKQAKAKALPGAVDFFNYAQSKGIEVFYVSNRTDQTLDITMKNMADEGFPYIDKQHFFLKTKSSDKTQRRDSIAKNYEIILLLGDNLRDFSEIFSDRPADFGKNTVEQNSDDFGTKFIVFPNPMYGEWEKAVYKNDYSYPDSVKQIMRKDALNDKF